MSSQSKEHQVSRKRKVTETKRVIFSHQGKRASVSFENGRQSNWDLEFNKKKKGYQDESEDEGEDRVLVGGDTGSLELSTVEKVSEVRKRGNSADSHVSWDIIGKFSMASLTEKYKNSAPTMWHILMQLATGSRKGGDLYRPKYIVSD